MAKLTTKQRNALPDSAFAGPNRSYPVENKAHAQNAKARASQFASPALKAKVFARANKVLGSGHSNVRNGSTHEHKLRHG
jgi:hypothetical protein